MARARDPEKRAAILNAAVHEIAENGLAAATAKIAARAGIATGTLFTYFPTKEDLLNELYVELKSELYNRINHDFPLKASLERRAHYIWTSFLDWAIAAPLKHKASVLLYVSDIVTPATRERTSTASALIDAVIRELSARPALRGLPLRFAAASMNAMQEATMDFIAKEPRRRKELTERGFQLFWRAVR